MKVFAFGSNGAGQLGLGHCDDVSVPQACLINSIQLESPFKVTAGGNHTLILSSAGKIFQAGIVYSKPCDSELNKSDSTKVTPVQGIKNFGKVKLCSSTWSTATLVNESDTLLSWGSGSKGELGRGKEIDFIQVPGKPFRLTEVDDDVSIVCLASSIYHVVAVLSSGDVYGWGNGRKGQLGQPAEVVWQPRKINDVDFKVTRAVCGREFTYLVGDSALGKHKILGTDKWDIQTNAPQSCLGWKDIGASWGSIFILKEDGALISWGRNDHGQLAPLNLPSIEQIAVGSEHVLALTNKKVLLAWGWGEHGNCGSKTDVMGDTKPTHNEIAVPDINLKNAAIYLGAGCATSWIGIKDGD